MREPSTPRLALARDLVRCALLEVDEVRLRMMELAERTYRMSDPFFEEHFLAVVEEREILFRIRNQRQEALKCR